jgi:hypothetical protein
VWLGRKKTYTLFSVSLYALYYNALPNRDVTMIAKKRYNFGGRSDILAFYMVWGRLIGGFELNYEYSLIDELNTFVTIQ